MASITTSVGGLIGSSNDKVDSITAVANGILCLPYILTEGIGGLINTTINTLASVLLDIASGLVGLINTVVSAVVDRVLGVIDKILGAILSIFNLIKSIINAAKRLLDNNRKGISYRENCRYVAAAIFKCLLSEAANSITKREAATINRASLVVDKTLSLATKITQPEQLIYRYTYKTSNMATRATKALDTLTLF